MIHCVTDPVMNNMTNTGPVTDTDDSLQHSIWSFILDYPVSDSTETQCHTAREGGTTRRATKRSRSLTFRETQLVPFLQGLPTGTAIRSPTIHHRWFLSICVSLHIWTRCLITPNEPMCPSPAPVLPQPSATGGSHSFPDTSKAGHVQESGRNIFLLSSS